MISAIEQTLRARTIWLRRPDAGRCIDAAAAIVAALAWVGLWRAHAGIAAEAPTKVAQMVPWVPLAMGWSLLVGLGYFLAARRFLPLEARAVLLAAAGLSIFGEVELYRLSTDLAVRRPLHAAQMIALPTRHGLHMLVGAALLAATSFVLARWPGRAMAAVEKHAPTALGIAAAAVVAAGLLGRAGSEPYEVFKLVFVAGLVWLLGRRLKELPTRPKGARELVRTMTPGLLVLATVLISLIRRRPDTGPAVVAAGTVALLFFTAGSRWIAGLIVVLVAAGGYLAYGVFHWPPLLVDRFGAWLNPFAAANETVARTLWLLAGAGFMGTGLGHGAAALDVPDVEADFTFGAVAEELGFAGGVVIIVLYLTMLLGCYRLARRAKGVTERMLILAIASLLAIQAMLPIMGDLACLPLTGITLPFVSNGGASYLVNSILIGILMGLAAAPAEAVPDSESPLLRRVGDRLERCTLQAFLVLVAIFCYPLLHLADVQILRPDVYQRQVFSNTRRAEQAAALIAKGIVTPNALGGVDLDQTKLSPDTDNPVRRGIAAHWVQEGVFAQEQGNVVVVPGAFQIRNPFYRRQDAKVIRGRIQDADGRDLQLDQVWFGYDHPRYGITGLTALLKPYLMGQEGRNLLDRSLAVIHNRQEGCDVQLEVTQDLQRAAEAALGRRSGVAMAEDPRTGGILALASGPHFPFSTAPDAEWHDAQRDQERRVFFSRPVRGLYTPGSAFKQVVAAAALEAGIPPERTFVCTGHWQVPGSGYTIHDDSGAHHGRLDMRRALKVSCNNYFAQLGTELGPDRLAAYFERAGLAESADIVGLSGNTTYQIRTAAGSLETQTGRLAEPAILAQSGFGQGEVRVNPVTFLAFVSAIANGGILQQPRLVGKVVSRSGVSLTTCPPREVRRIMSPKTAATLRDMMISVVEGGTGKRARIPGVKVAGKTSSVQHDLKNGVRPAPDAWFTCFAPVDDPHVAVLLLLENGGMGGRVAAPAARRLLAAGLARGGSR